MQVMIRLFSAVVLMFLGVNLAFAQTGELSGKVTDENKEGVPFANVAVKKNGVLVTGGATDFDGFYSIKPLDPGTYDVEFSALGYGTVVITGVKVNTDRITTVNQLVKPESQVIAGVEIVAYKIPLIDKESNSTKTTISAEEIKSLPTRNIQSIASTSAGVFQEDEGSEISIKGSRSSSTEYYIDGIRVRGSTNLPANAIEQLTVITGGVPARYGDATGGIINIVTKGPSRQLNGGVEFITSQFLDGFGYNLANFNLTGPIFIKDKGTDSAQAKIGFFIAGEFGYQKDPDPSAVGVWQVKDDKLTDLQNNPIVRSPVGDAFISSTQTVTFEDLEKSKVKPNTARYNYSLSSKLDFKITDKIGITVGGSINYSRYNDYIARYSLFNFENNPLNKELSWRVFARYTQRFGKAYTDPGEANKSPFQNAYYSLQFDYSKVYNTVEDESHGFKPFDYGYLGRYDIARAPSYETFNGVPGTGQITYIDANGNEKTLSGTVQTGFSDTLVTFTPSNLNPTTANFMTRYYELAGNDVDNYYRSLSTIQNNNGLRNGDRSQTVHGVWYNVGRQYNGYGITDDNDQFRLTFIGSVDILRPGASSRNKHALEFGFEFEQRIDRSYQITPIGLWELARLQANQHIVDPDLTNLNDFSLLIDGVEYEFDQDCRCFPNAPAFSVYDTILTNQVNNGTQSYFDRKLREKLGLSADNLDFINIDTISPDFFSLDMFSADELLNQGNPYVFYNGYDYTGKKLTGQPSFNDFFTEKDSEGNYTRNVGAFRPIYTAFFIQDKFQFKDLLFNVGLRIDRFDANNRVLADEFSLYKILTVDEAVERYGYAVPNSVGGDYKVYVDNFDKTTPTVTGFRNGNTWYTADGVEVADPRVIGSSSATSRPTPLLDNTLVNNIKSESFDPNNSFSDYKPQITVMPRLAFSFNLTDEASFFAHYDILAQRPQGRIVATPSDYYYFNEKISSVFNNPNLKPEKTIDYQIGFRQLVTQNSAITFSAFYREMRDMVQIVQVRYAYPRDYTTFGNVDFGTVKGFSLDFDMRKTRTSNLSLRINYTLQFADGTGSNDVTQLNLVGSGQPNLRTISPLSYDARHMINVTADYRFGEGDSYNGPMIKGKQFLSNFGINLIGRTRSGTPYTQQQNPTAEGKESVPQRPIPKGSINGARLPWTFRLDLRIDKGFNITPKNKETGKAGRPLYLNVYLWVQNLLDTRNIVKVYSYTGNVNDDGYLNSSIGQQDVGNQINPDSYVDLYNAWIDNPNNYSLPRTIRLGLRFDF